MKKSIKFIAVLCGLLTFQVDAADIPRPSDRDSRIQYVQYRDNDVVQLSIVVGTGSRIVFGDDEEIVNIAAGFTQGWQLEPVGNELFVSARSLQLAQNAPMTRPVPGEWDTNVMVTTTRGLYDFDVRLLKRDGRNEGSRAFYRIEFEYPENAGGSTPISIDNDVANAGNQSSNTTTQPGAIDQMLPTVVTGQRNAESAQVDTSSRLAPRNDEYEMVIGRNSNDIAPSLAYDDGLFTYLKFEENLDIPAAYLVRKSGTKEIETLVNGHVDPDRPEYIVLHRISEKFRLRLGQSVIDVYNKNFDPSSVTANEGTTIPGVKRVIK